MSKPRQICWKRIPSLGLLIGTGGLLGILAGEKGQFWQGTLRVGLTPPPSSPVATAGTYREPHPSGKNRSQDWLTRCRDASHLSTSDWAAALAPPGWIWGRNPAYKGEVERFVSVTKAEGIKKAMQAGVSGEFLSMAIVKQPPAVIPSLMEALLADPSLLSPGDLGQMIFDTTRAGSACSAVLAQLSRHLLKFHSDDQDTLDAFGTTVGRLHLEDVKVLTEHIADEASRESILASAVRARAGSMEAGPELTEVIENFVVGVPALQAAFKNAGMAKGNGHSSPREVATVLAWTRSLAGYKQTAALQGWIEALRDEHPVTEPIARFLTDTDSVKDAAFFSKLIELSTPAIIHKGQAELKELSAILAARPDRMALLEAQPKLKALLKTTP